MVRDVDDSNYLRDRLAKGHFNPLAQGDRRHATPGASTAQAEIGGVTFHRNQVSAPTVGCNAGVDLLLEDLYDPLGYIATEIDWWPGHRWACASGTGRLVGVLDGHRALFGVGSDVDDRAANLGNAVSWHDDREPATFLGPVIWIGVTDRLEVDAVGVRAFA